MSYKKNSDRRSQRRQREAGRSPALLIGFLLLTVAIITTVYLLKSQPSEPDFRSTPPDSATTTPVAPDMDKTPPDPAPAPGDTSSAPLAATPSPPDQSTPPSETIPRREGPIREEAPPAASEALERLVGRWLRPDGGYILEIRGFDAEGDLDAAYFNPRPIHISAARAGGSPEDLRIFIELTDVGYPGATYDLRYIAEQDVLAGFYLQPAVGQRFDVFFIRRE